MRRLSVLCLGLYALFLVSCISDGNNRRYVIDVLKKSVLERAALNLKEEPMTVTAFIAERSAGSIHDFYSEGDYWWPDTLNPDGPYVRRDGETNPNNFVAHRHAMIRFSSIVGNLTSAYLLEQDKVYVEAILRHIRAWFVNESTRMNPNLQYAQAIKGITSGRGIGIIDTIHLMEVAQSLYLLDKKGLLPEDDAMLTKQWFTDYLKWLFTHQYGIDEMNASNNHGTCWVMQVAVFARYVGNEETMDFCKTRYKKILLPKQMAEDGSFPLETARTKPYGYSLFNLDAMATICQTLSDEKDDLWSYTVEGGRNIEKGVDFIYPYLFNKESWIYTKDVMYWDKWPVAHPFLLFAALHADNKDWLDAWGRLEHFPMTDEVVRNLPIRNPLIWI